MASHRLFFALPLAWTAQRELEKAQARLAEQRVARWLRWTQPSGWHCTLKFVGNVSAETVAALIREAEQEATLGASPPVLSSRWAGIDGFPSLRRARVLVARLTDDDGTLAALAQALQELTASHDVPLETRPYRPHVTLARLRTPTNLLDLGEALQLSGNVELGPVTLYESHLRPSGSRYQVLWRPRWDEKLD